MSTKPSLEYSAAPFHTTRWTRVCLAQMDSTEGRRALADLCEAYYEPVIAYLRSALRDADTARELGHAFFEEILAGRAIRTADRERGQFRFYLLGAVKHFLARRREMARRLKRGGGVAPLSLDARAADADEPAVQVADDARRSPEAAFDRRWAVTVLARAMEALRAESTSEGKGPLFDGLRPWLLGESAHGDQAAAAAALGLSVGAMKVAVHRLRLRFRQCVKAEVAGTLNDGACVEEEMRSLFAALGG